MNIFCQAQLTPRGKSMQGWLGNVLGDANL